MTIFLLLRERDLKNLTQFNMKYIYVIYIISCIQVQRLGFNIQDVSYFEKLCDIVYFTDFATDFFFDYFLEVIKVKRWKTMDWKMSKTVTTDWYFTTKVKMKTLCGTSSLGNKFHFLGWNELQLSLNQKVLHYKLFV